MGWVKNKMMEMQDNGDWPSRDLAGKNVCTCHFQDKYLNGIIESHGKQGTCLYCGKDTNHLQYIPTQVFTEFLRYMFKDSKGHQIDGLIYGSSKTMQKNIVLFCNQKDSENFVDKNVKIEKFERTVGWKALK